jgi:hypothetical protein
MTKAITEKLLGLYITFGSTSSSFAIEGPRLPSNIDKNTKGKKEKQDPTIWD